MIGLTDKSELKTSRYWRLKHPRIKHLGITEPYFFRTEITQEAASLLARIPDDRPFFGVELGVWFAKSACILLQRKPLLELVLVDNWWEFPEMKEIALYNLSFFSPSRYYVIDGDSTDSAMDFTEEVDYVFVDACKEENKYYSDIMAWYPKIKKGGFMQGHDIDNPKLVLDADGARKAIERASKDLNKEFTVNTERYTWTIEK